MELSPRLLREGVEFGEQWRGYNQAEVDEFLERVAIALESLIEQFQATTARAEAAERRLLERGDDDEIRRTLVLAQRTAASAVEEARAEAERIVAAAHSSVADRVADAERRLEAAEAEIAERTRTELAALEARRAALAADVDALSAFVDEHRNRLAGELRRELAWLERPELSVPEPPPLQAGERAMPTSTPAWEPQPEAPTPEEAAAEHALADAGDQEPEGPADVPAGSDDLAAARQELERALSGVVLDPEAEGGAEQQPDEAPHLESVPFLDADADADDEAAPQPQPQPSPGRQIFDALAEEADEPIGESTGVFDALSEPDAGEQGDLEVRWRDERDEPSGEVDDDPFLTELRKAITDDDPLGPRDHEPPFDAGDDSEPAGSGWFRLRRPRG